MRSNKFLIFVIFFQAVTVFLLGILGNQLATLFQLPLYALIGITVLGLVVTIVLTYLLQRPSPEPSTGEEMTWSEIWERIRPLIRLRRRRYMNGYHFTDKYGGAIAMLGIVGIFVAGIVAAFLRLPFNAAGVPEYWWYTLLGLLLISMIFLHFSQRPRESRPTFSESITELAIMIYVLGMLLSFGLVIGFILAYFSRLVGFVS